MRAEAANRAAAITTRIDRDRDHLLGLVQELVRIPSVNPRFEAAPGLNREADVQEVVRRELEAAGMEIGVVETRPGRPNVHGRWDGRDDCSLIVNGHVDVVPAGDAASWSREPFGAEIEDGRLYGRGSYDMKAGLAAAIAAARALRESGVELAGRFEIHSVVDEEVGGFGSMDVVASGRTASAVIAAEPTGGEIMTAEGGLEWVRVTIRGRNAHAGWRYNDIYPQRPSPDRPVPGVNAAELAARFILALADHERDRGRTKQAHPLLPPGVNTINPGVVQVGSELGDDGLPVLMGNPAMTPDVAVVDLDLKFLPGETAADVRAEFEEFVHHWAMQDSWLRQHPPSVRWELGGLHFPPFDTPADHPLVRAVERQVAALGRQPQRSGFVAVCDAAHYARSGAAPIIYGPGGSGAHGPDEWVDLSSVVDAAKVYAAAAVEYCGVV